MGIPTQPSKKDFENVFPQNTRLFKPPRRYKLLKGVKKMSKNKNEQLFNTVDKVTFSAGSAIANVIFKFEEDESVIRGFLGLAEYFHTVVIKRKDEFFIPHASILFRLMSI